MALAATHDTYESTLWVFDLDGTLVDTLPTIQRTLNLARETFGGAHRTRDEVRAGVGAGSRALVERTCDDIVDSETAVDRFLETFMQFYERTSRDPVEFLPGARETLELLSASGLHATAVWTNKPLQPALETCRATGIDLLVDAIVAPENAGARKPDPQGLEIVRDLTARPDALATMVGDSRFDFEAGLRGGCRTIGVRCGYGDPKADPQPDEWMDDLRPIRDRLAARRRG